MALPKFLQPQAISKYFEKYNDWTSPLDGYFIEENNEESGDTIKYDILEYSRSLPKLVSRGAHANAVDETILSTQRYGGFTFRDERKLSSVVLRDERAPGEDSPAAFSQISNAVTNLGLKYEYFKAWMQAGALQGEIVYYAPGAGSNTVTQVLFDDTTTIKSTVSTSWATDVTGEDDVEVSAKELLDDIDSDIDSAKKTIAQHGMTADTIIMNSDTFKYIKTNFLLAGIQATEPQIYLDGNMPRIFGLNLDLVDATYIDPISGSATNLIPDDTVIVLSSNNSLSGRFMIMCESDSMSAPEGTYGFYANAQEMEKEPGGVILTASCTAAPMVGVANAHYVLEDVSAT